MLVRRRPGRPRACWRRADRVWVSRLHRPARAAADAALDHPAGPAGVHGLAHRLRAARTPPAGCTTSASGRPPRSSGTSASSGTWPGRPTTSSTELAEWIAFYKEHRGLLLGGDLVRMDVTRPGGAGARRGRSGSFGGPVCLRVRGSFRPGAGRSAAAARSGSRSPLSGAAGADRPTAARLVPTGLVGWSAARPRARERLARRDVADLAGGRSRGRGAVRRRPRPVGPDGSRAPSGASRPTGGPCRRVMSPQLNHRLVSVGRRSGDDSR